MAGGERKARINRFLTKQSEKRAARKKWPPFYFLLRGVADQDHISVRVTSKPGSWLAIKRPVKIPDTLPSEIGELLALEPSSGWNHRLSIPLSRVGGFAILVASHQPEARPLEVQTLENPLIDHAHPAAADLGGDAVMRDGLTSHQEVGSSYIELMKQKALNRRVSGRADTYTEAACSRRRA